MTEHAITERLRYDVTSQISAMPNTPLEKPSTLMQATTLPNAYNPRTLAFAANLRAQYGSDAALIKTVLNFFHQEKFSYTLEPPLLGKDSVDDFLFSTRAGFCEHYASAFVILMRAAGIPARVVTGYQGGDINPIDGMMTIRQSDAHAWAEVWLQTQGWTRVDPTAAVAPSRIHLQRHAGMPSQSFLGDLFGLNNFDHLDNLNLEQAGWQSKMLMLRAEWKNRWDALGNGWTQWVLNYTQDRQKSLLQTILRTLKIARSEQYDGHRLMSLLFALMLALGSIALAAVTLSMWLVARKVAPLDALYSTLCKRMSKHGLIKEGHEGPATFRRRLCAQDSPLSPEAKNAVTRFLKLYEDLRYGADATNSVINSAPSFRRQKSSHQFKKLKFLLSLC
ncbi:MAG: transglutaminase domain-containing protein, partial [Glaciimonas sp.]|nr:transglutaminase domain-containing protein [Glaciimonas sp.]